MTWRHADEVRWTNGTACTECVPQGEPCTSPIPDPASPCAEGDEHEGLEANGHSHIATLCQSCGHAITEAVAS